MQIDKELKHSIELMIQGNEEGFTNFYNQTYHYVYKRARFIMKNDEDAFDLTQETYIQAYKGISSLQDINNVYAWLGKITYNHGMRLFNKKQDVLVSEEAEEIFDNIVSTDMDTSPEDVAQTKATSEIIKNMIEELPELQKMALLAFYYDNMKIDDIATMFECSSNTIKSRLNYAKKALQEKVLTHEKTNNYRLCSVSPALILMAFDTLFGAPKYTMPVATANTVYAATKSALFMANASMPASAAATGAGTVAATSVGTATTTGAGTAATVVATGTKVGLSLTAKVAIALATATTTTAIAVTAATGGFQSLGVPPTETEVTSEVESSSEDIFSETETPTDSEIPTLPPLASIYDVQFTDYADSGHHLIMVTDGGIGSENNMTEKSLTAASNIYIYDKNGESYAFYNVDSDGQIKYHAISAFTASDKVLAMVYNKFQGVNLLLSDGSLFDTSTKFRSFNSSNGYIIALTSTGDSPTHNIYDSNLNLLKEQITEFDHISRCTSFGELTIVFGVTSNYNKFRSCIYDKDWNLIDCIEQPSSALNVYTVMNDSYLWVGDSLKDKNYNDVTLPIPDHLYEGGKQVTITSVSQGEGGPAYAYVKVLITDDVGNTTEGHYIIDENNNFYKDESELEAFLWVEGIGINVMFPPYTADRYIVIKETGEYICSMSDWDVKVNEVYGSASVYGIYGDMYGEDVLALVDTTNAEGYHSTTFLLKKSDGYSIENAINIGAEIVCRNGLYYAHNTTKLYLDYKLVDCHSIIFTPDHSYYVMQNADGTFTIYNPDQTEVLTTTESNLYLFGQTNFISETTIDGVTYYKLCSYN